MRSDEIHPGDLIAGKYRVRTILGRKHGLLVEGFHTEFDQRVVIKILLPGYGEEKEIERFRREARTLSKLESEHAARIIDVGTQPDGSFYLVRQFLEGTDLDTFVRQNGPLPLHEAVLYVLQAAEAVAETHSHGIIVRELEPRNLFWTERAGGPCVKIIDFGTAKLMRDLAAPTAGGELTATAMFGLSPFSSPELVRKAKNVDVRTDVWSLGAVLYHLLTGRPPFSGETGILMLQITKEQPTPVTHLRPDLPPEIESILGWALAKDIDARFRNVHALAHALAPYANAEGQVLVERIGRMTESARSRRGGAPGVPPPPASGPYSVRPSSPPPPPQSRRELDFDDSVTQYRPLAGHGPASYGGPPSSRGGAVAPGPPSVPPPPPPESVPAMHGYGVPAAPASLSPSGLAAPASAPPGHYPTLPQAQASAINRKLALGLLAAAAVLLPLVIALLFLRTSTSDTNLSVLTEPRVVAPNATMPEPQVVTPVKPTATTPPPQTAAVAPPVVVIPQSPATPKAPAASPAEATPPRPQAKQAPAPPPQPAAPPPPEPEPAAPQAAGGMGTLVAVATGGTCAFSVNGATKGTGSSTKVQLKPGTYSVTCKPSGGSAKSRSVTVKSGETAMVSFKL